MRIFVSYARNDRAAVERIIQDLRRARHQVWIDEELTGGQAWWDAVLNQIRTCELFVLALSPDMLKSRACAAEYGYAVACRRSVLPVMISRVPPQMAPPAIANAQIIDYIEHTPAAAISLVTAVSSTPPAPPSPDPPPSPPAVPMSYMNTYRERLGELSLTLQQQAQLLSELRAHLNDDDDREIAMSLIRELRQRGDITETVGREIDVLLAGAASTGSSARDAAHAGGSGGGGGSTATASSSGDAAAGWHRDPFGRHEQRYWDGARWTEHVADAGQRAVDPPTAAGHPGGGGGAPSVHTAVGPARAGVDPPFSTAVFVGLIVASLCVGLVGLIVGVINLNKPQRRSQAITLIVVGAISLVLGLMITLDNASSSQF